MSHHHRPRIINLHRPPHIRLDALPRHNHLLLRWQIHNHQIQDILNDIRYPQLIPHIPKILLQSTASAPRVLGQFLGLFGSLPVLSVFQTFLLVRAHEAAGVARCDGRVRGVAVLGGELGGG